MLIPPPRITTEPKEMQNANKKIAFYSSTKKYLCSFALNDKGICMYWG